MIRKFIISAAILLSPASVLFALGTEETAKLVASIDEKQRNTGDYKSLVFIEEKERDKPTKLLEAVVYRRDEDDKWIILLTKPKSEAGKGYLRIDKNIFLYEPVLGRWERMTERARIGGTNSQRSDFDESRLSEEFSHQYIGLEKLGKFSVHHLKLSAKPNIDVAFPISHLWVDKETQSILKKQDYSMSEKLMRTTYYPKWERMYSQSKKADVFVPKEIRIFDEVEKDNSTVIFLKEVSLDALEVNIFTKAWIEKKSK